MPKGNPKTERSGITQNGNGRKIGQTLQIGSNAAGQAQYSRFCAKTQQLFVKLVFYEELCLSFSRAFRLPLSAAEAFCKFFIS